jgi:hypothetical protein
VSRDRIAIVEDAIAVFNDGDEAGVVAHLAPSVCVYTEPQLTSGRVMEGREAVREWMATRRARVPQLRMRLLDPVEYEGRLVADVLVVAGPETAGGGWRMSVAIWFEDDLIAALRLFWHRDSARAALEERG